MTMEQTIAKLVDAWNDQDVDGIVAAFAPHGSFHEAAGPDQEGRTSTGPEAIRAALERVFGAFPEARIVPAGPLVVAGNRALCEWDWEFTTNSGNKRVLRGIDLFAFEGAKVLHKSTYLKQYTPR